MPQVRSGILPEPTSAEIRARLASLETELVSRAVHKGVVKSPADAEIMDLEPDEDLGLANKVWAEDLATANAYNTVVDGRDVGDKVIGIVGVINTASTPLTTNVQFLLGTAAAPTAVRGRFHIEPMYVQEEKKALFTRDIIYEKGEKISIRQYAKAAGTDNLQFIGRVVQSKGTRGPSE